LPQRDAERVGQECAQRGIGLAIDRRRRKAQLQRCAMDAGNLRAPRTRLHVQGKHQRS
jgi:hypothetical protein